MVGSPRARQRPPRAVTPGGSRTRVAPTASQDSWDTGRLAGDRLAASALCPDQQTATHGGPSPATAATNPGPASSGGATSAIPPRPRPAPAAGSPRRRAPPDLEGVQRFQQAAAERLQVGFLARPTAEERLEPALRRLTRQMRALHRREKRWASASASGRDVAPRRPRPPRDRGSRRRAPVRRNARR